MALKDADYNPALAADAVLYRNPRTGTESSNAVTVNGPVGIITTSSLTTGTASAYAISLTNSSISGSSVIIASVTNLTNTGGLPVIGNTGPNGAGVGTVTVVNANSANGGSAFNGTLRIGFVVLN